MSDKSSDSDSDSSRSSSSSSSSSSDHESAPPSDITDEEQEADENQSSSHSSSCSTSSSPASSPLIFDDLPFAEDYDDEFGQCTSGIGSDEVAVDVYTMEYKDIPEPAEMRKRYKQARREFMVLKKERDTIVKELEEVIATANGHNFSLPNIIALWMTMKEGLTTLHKMMDPKADVPDIDGSWLDQAYRCDFEKIEDKVTKLREESQELTKAVFSRQSDMFRMLIPLAKGFLKSHFTQMVTDHLKMFVAATGMTAEELLKQEPIDGDSLVNDFMKWTDFLKGELHALQNLSTSDERFSKLNLAEVYSTPEQVGAAVMKLFARADRFETALFNDDPEAWWSEYTKNEEMYAEEDADDERVKRLVALETKAEKRRNLNEDKYHEMDKICRKIGRNENIAKRLKRERMIIDEGIDENGQKISKIAQEDWDKMKEELDATEKQEAELKEQVNMLQERGKELNRQFTVLEQNMKFDDHEIQSAPDIAMHETKMIQLAMAVKLLRKEAGRLSEYENACNIVDRQIDEHIATEDNEIDEKILLIEEEEKKELEELLKVNNELRQERAKLPQFPEKKEEFHAKVAIARAESEKLQQEMNQLSDRPDPDLEIDELENRLDKYTVDFDKHIRIEFDDPLFKNLELPVTKMTPLEIEQLDDLTLYESLKELHELKQLQSAEEVEERMAAVEQENEKSVTEVVRLKQLLAFLETASEHDKRRFYTREAERRVRFSRHFAERMKERISTSKKIIECQTKSEDALGERYELVQQWVEKLDESIKKQEDKNSSLFAEFLSKVPTMKKQGGERKEIWTEVEQKMAVLRELEERIAAVDSEEERISLEVEEMKDGDFEVEHSKTVEQQLELNQEIADSVELNLLIEQEQNRIKDIETKLQAQNDAERRLGKRAQKMERKLAEANSKREEREKIAKYGSYTKMIVAETERLKQLSICSNCKTREKSAIITNCCHIFCLQCIEDLVRARNRKCPKCKNGFGQRDYKKIYLGGS